MGCCNMHCQNKLLGALGGKKGLLDYQMTPLID